MTDILPGYQVHFTTWENDGDAYRTTIWSGIESVEDVKFLVDLAQKFTSKNGSPKGLGNSGVAADVLIDAVRTSLLKFDGISTDMRMLFDGPVGNSDDLDGFDEDELEELANNWHEILCDKMLSDPVEELYRFDFERFCRVIDEIEVYHAPTKAENVTSKFV